MQEKFKFNYASPNASTAVDYSSLRAIKNHFDRFVLFFMYFCYSPAPREGILSEILIPSGGDVCPPLEQRPTKAENAATAKDAAPEDAAPAKVLEEGERSKPLHPDKGLQGSVQAGVAVHAGVSSSCQEAVVVGRLSFCGHPELHGNLCTSCGRRVIAPEEIATGVGEVSAVNGSHSGAIGISKRGIGGACGEGVHGGERDRVAPMTMAKVTMKGGGTLTVSSTGEIFEKYVKYSSTSSYAAQF